MNKICSICKLSLSIDNFHKRRVAKDGLDTWCKDCKKVKQSECRLKHLEKRKEYDKQRAMDPKRVLARELYEKTPEGKINRLKASLKHNYGITLDDYNRMLEEQNYECAGCKYHGIEDRTKRLFVDHCHETGKVRGLLCSGCNKALGLLRDNPQTLLNLADYLNIPRG